jgi:hypothetical protein
MIIWQLRNEGIYKTHINGCFLSYITSAQLHTSLIVVNVDYSSYKLTCQGRKLTCEFSMVPIGHTWGLPFSMY